MFILEYQCIYSDGMTSCNTSLYESEEDALMDACNSILELIKANASYGVEANTINDYIKLGNYREAVDHWNHIEFGGGNNINLYYVYEHTPAATGSIAKPVPLEDEFLNGLRCRTTSSVVQEWKAAEPGAKCSECGTYNEHAYATNVNGTFKCYSCRNGI